MEKAKDRKAKLDRISRGETSITVGTHALIQPDVKFKQMSLAVIDEQHRFGVEQRKLTSSQKNQISWRCPPRQFHEALP